MNAPRLVLIASIAALTAGAVAAQDRYDDQNAKTRDRAQSLDAQSLDTARSAESQGVNTSAVIRYSPTPPDQAYRLRAGDAYVVTNGPVPDTAANRARYGGPMSHGGRSTAPAGN